MEVFYQMLAWFQSDFFREPIAWVALGITLFFAAANYRITRAKYLQEISERQRKKFSVMLERVLGYYDIEIDEDPILKYEKLLVGKDIKKLIERLKKTVSPDILLHDYI